MPKITTQEANAHRKEIKASLDELHREFRDHPLVLAHHATLDRLDVAMKAGSADEEAAGAEPYSGGPKQPPPTSPPPPTSGPGNG